MHTVYVFCSDTSRLTTAHLLKKWKTYRLKLKQESHQVAFPIPLPLPSLLYPPTSPLLLTWCTGELFWLVVFNEAMSLAFSHPQYTSVQSGPPP